MLEEALHNEIRDRILDNTFGWGGNVRFEDLPSRIRPIASRNIPEQSKVHCCVPSWGGENALERVNDFLFTHRYHGTHNLRGLREFGRESKYYWEVSHRKVEKIGFAKDYGDSIQRFIGPARGPGKIPGPWAKKTFTKFIPHNELGVLNDPEKLLNVVSLPERLCEYFQWIIRVKTFGIPPRCRKPKEFSPGWWVLYCHEDEVVRGCQKCGCKPGIQAISDNSFDCYNWFHSKDWEPICRQCASGGNKEISSWQANEIKFEKLLSLHEGISSWQADKINSEKWDKPPEWVQWVPENWRLVREDM